MKTEAYIAKELPLLSFYRPTAVPKHVAIEAVRGIFRMGNGERGRA